jgi:isopentenyldiphosphate isomerase
MRRIPFLLSSNEMSILQRRISLLATSKTALESLFPLFFEERIVGYVQPSSVPVLKENCGGIFHFDDDKKRIRFQDYFGKLSFEDKTSCLNSAGKQMFGKGCLKNWRGENFPILTRYKEPPICLIDRGMVAFLGLKAYGIHINGFLINPITGVISQMYVAKRSSKKATWAGMLDHLVSGGLPYGVSLQENVVKECAEEASIPEELARKARPARAVSYYQLDERNNLKRDVLFCYDLQLPEDFHPVPQDGEVESFERQPIEWVLEKLISESGDEYKPNCYLVLVDFFIR